MSVKCWFGHLYRPFAAYHYIDTSWGMRQPTTNVSNRCDRCGRIQVDQLVAGHHELVDLQRNLAGAAPGLPGDSAALLAALTSTDLVDDPTLATTHLTGRRALRADEAQRVAAVVADTLGGGS